MLPCSCFCDDSLFPHTTGEEGLPDAVIDLMRSGVSGALVLKVDLRSLKRLTEIFAMIERRRSPDICSVEVG